MSNSVSMRAADNIRILAASMVEKAGSGHPGGAMGGADFIHVLYSEFLKFDPKDSNWANRDRFFLDPGHMSPMLYSTLALIDKFSMEELSQFRQWESPTPGHPEVDVNRGIENTSGPLGQGHAMALGAAIAERFLVSRFGEFMNHKTYTFISDGGVQEEISQGVGRLAGHLGLNNLIMFYDSNSIQLSSGTEDVTSEDTAKKYEAWGWKVISIVGNDHDAIRGALKAANEETEKPTLIIGTTIMGKGVVLEDGTSFEGECATHGMPLSKAGASYNKTIENLGGNADNPFVIFDDVAEEYKNVLTKKEADAATKKEVEKTWAKENPELSAKLNKFLSNEIPDLDWNSIEQKADIATRAASGKVLSVFADKVENMIVSSADLSNSDNTDGFLKNSTILKKGDFSGAFLQAGVAELTMACVMNGIALHGGIIPVCATFFVFSDYMKPAVRMAALMELPVKYVWTHDAFRVGEDGPTHQPVEQEAQIRLLEKMNNLAGKRSMLVLRPADAEEATISWKLAIENTSTPTAFILSRQNIKNLPATADVSKVAKGAYTVVECKDRPDLILLANGSEVATLVEAAEILTKEKNLKVRVVSAPSEGLFTEQAEDYKEKILTFGVPVLGLTAGVPVSLKSLAGPLGKVIGMERFGASAPYTVLDEKFGYTAKNVIENVTTYLSEYNENLARLTSM